MPTTVLTFYQRDLALNSGQLGTLSTHKTSLFFNIFFSPDKIFYIKSFNYEIAEIYSAKIIC